MTEKGNPRIYLSGPHLCGREIHFLKEALDSNWIAPLGPQVDAFEEEFAHYIGVKSAAALSSGTAALHLGLRLAGVVRGDKVFCSTLTFVASASPILYLGAVPVFLDADPDSWKPGSQSGGRRTRASFQKRANASCPGRSRHLWQSADYERIERTCERYGVAVVEDAAESLGATYRGSRTGRFGKCAAFSFNGNKIITTSGGGMLVSDDEALIQEARLLAAQAESQLPTMSTRGLATTTE